MSTVTGWTVLNETQFKLPIHLMAVDVPVVERNHSEKIIKEYQMKMWNQTTYSVTSTMFCAGY